MSLAADKENRIGQSDSGEPKSSRYGPLLWWLLVILVLAALSYATYFFISSQEKIPQEASLQEQIQATRSSMSSGRLPVVETDQEVVLDSASEAEVLHIQEQVQTVDESILPEQQTQISTSDKYSFALPLLDESDSVTRTGIAGLSSHPVVLRSLQKEGILERLTLLIDNIKRGRLPYKQFKFLAPKGRFIAKEDSSGDYILDPQNYSRYNFLSEIFESLDPVAVSEVYNKLKPLFQEAYEQLGYPDQSVNDALLKAIGQIQSTPVLTGEVRLIRPSVMYKYADPTLESLNTVQKQLIRMGPRNSKIIQAKLTQIKQGLKPSLGTD